MDQDVKPSGQTAAVAVGVADGDGGHDSGAGGDKRAAVADLPPGGQGFHVGDPAEQTHGGSQGEKAGVHLVAGVQAVGDDAGTNHLVVVVEVHQSGGIVQVADENADTPAFQHGVESVETFRLCAGAAEVIAVGGGKMAEQPLCGQPRQGGDFSADVGVGFRYLKTDAAHARVHGKVKGCGYPRFHGSPGQGFPVLPAENGGADTQTNGVGESLRRRVAQNQYRPGNSGVPQLQRFGHGADAEKSAPIFQQPGDRHGAVAVGVGLDDRHHRHFGLAADRVKIGRNSVQVNDRPGAVVGHNPSGSFRA